MHLSFVLSIVLPLCMAATNLTEIFKRPVINRIYQSKQYTLADNDASRGNRVNISQVASAVAALKPSYVCSFMYIGNGDQLTDEMVNDFNTVRSAVLAVSPNARMDVMVDLNPGSIADKKSFPNATSVTSFLEEVDAKLHLNAWWFDNWYIAYRDKPELVTAALAYARARNQTVGGNIINNIVPPGSDGVTIVDFPDNSTSFGFGVKASNIKATQKNGTSTVVLGHLNNNPQFGNGTESCVYMWDWNSTRRFDYLNYWLGQEPLGLTYMLPIFFPLCPGNYSFDPTSDIVNGNKTLYDYIKGAALGNGTSVTSNTTTTGPAATATHTSKSFGVTLRGSPALPCLAGILLSSLIWH